jgi:MFS transporter, DHA3 family, macrolide efflux protein
VKNARAYRLLFAANIVSGFAQGITMLAIPWYFITQLGQPELFGIIYGVVTILMIFWGLYAGSLIDRFSRKWVFFGVNLFGLALLASMSFLGFLNDGPGALGAMLVFMGTIFIFNIHYPALYAFGQEISDREDYARFTSWAEIIGQSTSIASGAVGALLLAGVTQGDYTFAGRDFHIPFNIRSWRLEEIFLADAITYAIGLLLIYFIRYTPVSVRIKENGSAIKRIKTGIRFLRENPLILMFGNASYAIFVVLLITVQQLLPVYTDQHLNAGAGWYALSEMLYSIGAMLAGVGMIWAFRKKNLVFGVITLMICTVGIYLICAFSTLKWLFAILCVLLGLCNAGTRVLRTTWIFNHVPNQTIGRVSSVFQTVNTLLRGSFSLLFALPFFNRDGQVIYAYLICALFIGICVVPIILKYKQLVNFQIKPSLSS